MLGAIIGDIVGSRFEFHATNDYNFELFTDECGFTDDTICTCAVADALLKGKDFGESIHEWCRLYPHPKGSYGGRFAQWVQSDDPKPYGSFGNGAAMRVSPIAWAHSQLDEALSLAEESASCSHNHKEGIKGAQTTVMAIHYGIEAHRRHPQVSKEQIKRILDECVKFSGYNIDICKEDVINRFDETCQGTVPVALWIIGQSTSFEDAIRKAVSLGADADTLGAIVGSIAEAIWGIPEELQIKALEYLPDDMKNVVHRFYDRFENDSSQAIMQWKLGLGDMNKLLNGEDPLPDKTKVATSTSWKTEPMPQTDISRIKVNISVTEKDMHIIRKGHIPEVMEDHWFMYCDEEYIRYFRSWSGACAFEAHFHQEADHYVIDEICINHALMEFGVNGDKAGVALFLHLLIAEVGGDARASWQAYLDA